MVDVWALDRYIARRKVFTIFGAEFQIFDSFQNPVAYVRQKAFKLKEDIRVYRDASMTEELLLIRARSAIDFSAAYDVVDAASARKLGALRRKGFSSLMRDSWEILDPGDQALGAIREDNVGMAILRRFVSVIPQRHYFEVHGQRVGSVRQRFNLFVHKFDVDLSADFSRSLPRPLALAGVILLLAIEGRQG